jgi:enoyl-CoA hydratase
MISSTPKATGRATFTSSDGVAWLTLDNPTRLNAISLAMWQQIREAIQRYDQDRSLRCLVVRGAGDKAFASGADISEFDSLRTGDAAKIYDMAAKGSMALLESTTKPTVAVVDGYCIGGGLALALCCDIRVASEDARFSIPAARLGLGYDYVGIKRLVDLVGPSRAKLIFFSARGFGAEEAKSIGIVDMVVPKARLVAEANELVANITDNAPLTISAAKRAIATTCMASELQDVDAVEAMAAACFASDDYAEGRCAFAEKRRPSFKGR